MWTEAAPCFHVTWRAGWESSVLSIHVHPQTPTSFLAAPPFLASQAICLDKGLVRILRETHAIIFSLKRLHHTVPVFFC